MKEKVLIIGHHFPEPKSSAAGSRMLQIIACFQKARYHITFACASSKNENAFNLSTLDVEEVAIQLNHESFDVFIKGLQPDIVIFDRFITEEQFGWRVAEQCPNAARILDTEDLHCLRKGRRQALKEEKPFDKTYLFNDIAKREIASIYRCDLSLIISEAEIEILQHDFKVDKSLCYYLPFLLDKVTSEDIDKLPSFENRDHFVTIGNFLHPPNYDAVLYLKTTIWPLIRKQLPKAEMQVYGAYASQKVTQLHNEQEGFLIKGFAKDVNEVMQQAKVCLAPLRFGAGLKGKLVDAMQNGLPCAMSTIAAEGMFGPETSGLESNGFVEDDAQVFAQKAVELYSNKTTWEEKQGQGFSILEKRFFKADFEESFMETVQHTIEQLETLRLQNFTGQMLQHQSMQSTKFMSKWIEEKHKNNL
jgi:glycosyltransferase involved in cell wall biosynthesis